MSTKKLTLSQLEQYLSKAAWILKGPVDATDFKVYIFSLLFFKWLSDVYDEEYQEALEESGGDMEYASLPENSTDLKFQKDAIGKMLGKPPLM
jgi:type I restriction enzyme M protein